MAAFWRHIRHAFKREAAKVEPTDIHPIIKDIVGDAKPHPTEGITVDYVFNAEQRSFFVSREQINAAYGKALAEHEQQKKSKIPEFKNEDELRAALKKAQTADGFFTTPIPEDEIVVINKKSKETKKQRIEKAIKKFQDTLGQ